MKQTLLFDTDSYKFSHFAQYPKNTTSVFSYIESRGGDFEYTVFFGLQYILRAYFFENVTDRSIEKAEKFCEKHGVPFNKSGWQSLIRKYGSNVLPLRIRAVPEGSIITTGNILISVENTDPEFYWLTSVIETALLRVWYPITVATVSKQCKNIIMEYLKKTCENPEKEIDFKLHDFGSRGVSSQESAEIGGMAHLVNFKGSDTVVGILAAEEYYNCDMAGFSIPAMEHSTVTSWGRENEARSYENMLDKFAKPGSIVACVSDSYDIYNACKNIWGKELKQKVIDSGATIVIRPDSGDPCVVVPKVLSILAERFGYTVNKFGYNVLNNVRVLQGDGVNINSIGVMLQSIVDAGFSAENVAFGMGGGLLQMCNRDTLKFAMKCSSITADGKEIDVYKDPVTDTVKKSKRGRLDLVKVDGEYKTIKLPEGILQAENSEMVTVYEDGELRESWDFDEIRERASR